MTQSPATSLASHLISQIRSNLSLLEQLSIIQPQDADQIRTKLPPPNGPFPSLDVAAGHNSGNGAPGVSGNAVIPSVSISSPHSPGHTQAQGQAQAQGQGGIEQGMARMGLNHQQQHQQQQQQQVSTPTQVQSAVMAPPALPSRGSVENRAKAIWDYTGNEADDLRFRAGDIIIIDEEVNSQWYRGRVIPQGEQYPRDFRGLFPSNYVEKIPGGGMSMMPYQPPPPPVVSNNSYYNQPPPQHMSHGQHYQGQVVVHEEDKKPNKFGKIGSQLGNSAVNGAGFGFGAAAASSLVNHIF